MGPSSDVQRELRAKLVQLRQDHRDLDIAIAVMVAQPHLDMLQLSRMKKRKLQLKDEIARIEDQLLPDIIA